jgi:hypothetical protein
VLIPGEQLVASPDGNSRSVAIAGEQLGARCRRDGRGGSNGGGEAPLHLSSARSAPAAAATPAAEVRVHADKRAHVSAAGRCERADAFCLLAPDPWRVAAPRDRVYRSAGRVGPDLAGGI